MDQAKLGLGKIITGGQEMERDAIHIAVMPMKAGEKLAPAEWVTLGELDGLAYGDEEGIGIVDPYLDRSVKKGERFWLFLVPGSISSLRHVWTHDVIDGQSARSIEPQPVDKQAESEKWLRKFIGEADCPSYDKVIAAAIGDHEKNADQKNDPAECPGYYNSSNDGEYLHFGGRDAHGEIPPEFWDHVEIVTGHRIFDGQRARFFSCSC